MARGAGSRTFSSGNSNSSWRFIALLAALLLVVGAHAAGPDRSRAAARSARRLVEDYVVEFLRANQLAHDTHSASYTGARHTFRQQAPSARRLAAPAGAGAAPADKPACQPKKLMWWTAIGGKGKTLDEYSSFLRVAVLSAREHAPSLEPHLIWSGPAAHPFLDWYAAMGGTVHHHKLTFYPLLREAVVVRKSHSAGWLGQNGAYLRLEIPMLMQSMTVDASKVDPKRVLYTDTDVMFAKDINSCTAPNPPAIALGPEFKKDTMSNSGVMVVNVTRLGEDHRALIDWGVEHDWPGTLDQTLLLKFYGDRLTLLPNEWNWKGYWGESKGIVIHHLHGPKPQRCLDCLVLSSMDDLPLKACKCPHIYLHLWKQAPDKGQYYRYTLLKYYAYLVRSLTDDGIKPLGR